MQQQPTYLPDVTELDWSAATAYAQTVVLQAGASGWQANQIARAALAALNEAVIWLAAYEQVRLWWLLLVAEEPARVDGTPADDRAALRGELAHAAERERVRAMLEELAAERPHIGAYGRAIEALDDGAEWWYERGALVVQRVRGSRHVIGAAGCECLAGQHGRQCWASGLATALERLERRRMAA